ncbi:hypothetical protein LOZ54_004701 [Ophidiomyces ophidiicola]|nr:hypothetical protein LOZ54_004701 [Ophidiomyces ophidiicola]
MPSSSPSPTHHARPMVPPPSPRSSSLAYTNHHYSKKTNANASMSASSSSTGPDIYSPTAAQFPARPARQSPVLPETALSTLPKCLPPEVYECILAQLQILHLGGHGEGCITCLMRDLHSLSLTNRAWERVVRNKLYRKIYINGIDSPAQLKKYRWKRGSRLKLLRRTLRERKLLANVVLELRVPELDLSMPTGKQNANSQEYLDLVASVVMVCPNLERLLGIILPYAHDFDRLTHALSTRKKLKEHAWVIGEHAAVTERAKQQSSKLLDQGQVYQFLSYHTFWSNLETLMLHSLGSNGILEHGIVLRMLNFLPALRHLSVSCFHANDFTDRTLLFLPPLISLRLESLPGVTENGLSRYISRQEARGLQSLTLIEQNLTSLLVLSKILSSLRRLERLSVVQQETAPTLPEGRMVFQPILASSSLKHLHWDLASPNPDALCLADLQQINRPLNSENTPNFHLSQSILNAGFPALKTLRAPNDIDPLGALQSVCRPTRNGQIMLVADRYSLPRSSHGTISKRPVVLPSGDNLSSARIRAQTLIDSAAREVDRGIKVIVTDHSANQTPPMPAFSDSSSEDDFDEIDGILDSTKQKQKKQPPSKHKRRIPPAIKVQEFTIPGCIGRVYNSVYSTMAPTTPTFTLRPDIPCSDADGGLLSWKHILTANQTWFYSTPSPVSLPVVRAGTASSLGGNGNGNDDVPSPSPTSSRFTIWSSNGGAGSNPASLPSPRTPTSPMPPMSPFAPAPTEQASWSREMCNGSWNQGHRLGKDWWIHVEREVVGNGRHSGRLLELSHLF